MPRASTSFSRTKSTGIGGVPQARTKCSPLISMAGASPDSDPLAGEIIGLSEQISERLTRVNTKHQKVNESLRAIRSQGVRLLGPGAKMSQNAKAKLLALYQTAQKQCESEHSNIEHLLLNIQKVRQIRLRQKMADKMSRGSLMMLLAQYAASLPMYIGSVNGHPPPLVGAIPQQDNEPIPEGDFVAAFVEDVWILAEVKEHLSTNRYLVKDIDDDDGGDEKERAKTKLLNVPGNGVIALPHCRADPRHHTHALFPRAAIVLALYPQTTCFYKGIVETPPAGPNDDYMIAFEDSTFPSGYSPTLPVPQLYVLTHREIKTATGDGGGAHRKRKRTSSSPKNSTNGNSD